jgi:hypothetical protein
MPNLRLGEFVATLAPAQDNAFGQPLESQLRSCLLATWLCEAAGFAKDARDTAYWVAQLRYLGCTGHAHEVATVFGDEIAIRAQTLVHDAANPAEVMRDVIAFATAGRPQDCASPQEGSRRSRSPTSSSSPRRLPITTSSTSTIRSGCRHEPPPRFGPCSTPSCNRNHDRDFVR